MKFKGYNTAFYIILMVILFSSCTMHIEKRRYLPGYHISTISKKHPSPDVRTSDSHITKNQEQPILISSTSNLTQKGVDVVVKNEPEVVPTVKSNPGKSLIKVISDNCDEIVLFNGQKILAIVELVGEKEIRYKKCDDPKGLTYQIRMAQVSHINLSNGDVFQPKNEKPVNVNGLYNGANVTFIMSIIGMSLAVISFVFAFLIFPFPFTGFIIGIVDILYSLIVGAVAIKFHRSLKTLQTKLTLWFAFLVTLLILILAFVIMAL